jgi:hypothetical protein
MSRVMAEGAKICRCEDCGRVTKCRLEFYDGSPPEFAWVCGPCIRREVRYGADATLRSLQAATLHAAANECRYERAFSEQWQCEPEPPPAGKQWRVRVRTVGPGQRARMLVLCPVQARARRVSPKAEPG